MKKRGQQGAKTKRARELRKRPKCYRPQSEWVTPIITDAGKKTHGLKLLLMNRVINLQFTSWQVACSFPDLRFCHLNHTTWHCSHETVSAFVPHSQPDLPREGHVATAIPFSSSRQGENPTKCINTNFSHHTRRKDLPTFMGSQKEM